MRDPGNEVADCAVVATGGQRGPSLRGKGWLWLQAGLHWND